MPDILARLVGEWLSERLGQPVIIDNRPGAATNIGTEAAARARTDGYTLVLMDPAIVINPTLQPSMPYDLFKQLQTVSIISTSPEVLVVAPQLPVKTVAELIAYAKAKPGELFYGTPGLGSTAHLPPNCSSR